MMFLKALALQVLGSSGVSVQQKELSAGEDVMAALRAEAEIPLDPSEEGGVLRATLLEPRVNGSTTQATLALTLHAVAGMEPSLALLQRQLLEAYAGARAGGRASIKAGLQFRDVLYWLSQRQEQGTQTLSFHLVVLLLDIVWPACPDQPAQNEFAGVMTRSHALLYPAYPALGAGVSSWRGVVAPVQASWRRSKHSGGDSWHMRRRC